MTGPAIRTIRTKCELWTGSQTQDGYGLAEVGDLYDDGKRHRTLAHRARWMREIGPIEEGYEVHHRCRNRLCVRLSHLVLMLKGEHAAQHAQKTQCKRGHPLSGDNVYYDPKYQQRQCRACWPIRYAERKRRGGDAL